PARKSWVTVPEGSDFPIQNLPFGIFQSADGPHLAVAIGEELLDITALAATHLLDVAGIPAEVLNAPTLNALAGMGRPASRALRECLSDLLLEGCADADKVRPFLHKLATVQMLMPVQIGDYTDFYSSIEHATNVGIMFRGKENALMPNWKHIPVGYHGRASSIVVSGTPTRRPMGQMRPDKEKPPIYGASRLLDFELETAFIVGKPNDLGDQVPISEAEDHIFGMVLLNDWSARDIQGWEYVPLGPFLGKSFASICSPWVVTMDALEPFRVAGPSQDPTPLPYLQAEGAANFDIALEVLIAAEGQQAHCVSRSNFKYMYWSMKQQLAHHTVNGCNLRAGDLCGSGTISGPTPDSYGSMMELTWRGANPLTLPDGSQRKFINDSDTVIMRGTCEKDGVHIGFGEASSKVLPAK
ncbi:MAG TPA: fumarylacetoacetase, partial [Bacteroidetes bacterium]|nr:fumarylacetoacetase [Bacteroidota bacterium]